MAILDHTPPPATQPPTAAQRAPEKNTRKSSDTLTPWRNGLLPGHSMGDILNEHLALVPTTRPLNDPSEKSPENTP